MTFQTTEVIQRVNKEEEENKKEGKKHRNEDYKVNERYWIRGKGVDKE